MKWEYKIAASVDDIHMIGALDKLGAEGWELIGFDGRGIAFFKRPGQVPPAKLAAPNPEALAAPKK